MTILIIIDEISKYLQSDLNCMNETFMTVFLYQIATSYA